MNRQQHLNFMNDKSKWPKWPYLPLKRPITDTLNTGLLLAVSGKRATHVLCDNLYSGTLRDLFEKYKTPDNVPDEYWKTYNSLEEIYDDGWRVD